MFKNKIKVIKNEKIYFKYIKINKKNIKFSILKQ